MKLRRSMRGPLLPLATILAVALLGGCKRTEPSVPLELESLTVDPGIARAGTSLTIQFISSRQPSVAPVVTVAEQLAEAVEHMDNQDGSVRHVFSYDVTGGEPEGEAIVLVAVNEEEGRITIQASVFLDFTPPTITDLVGPTDPTEDTQASFSFGCSEEECQFECSLQGVVHGTLMDEAACESGISFVDLAVDTYTFAVRPTDPAGNEGQVATWVWTVTSGEVVSGPDRRSAIHVTSGGEEMTSPSHTMRVWIGGPAPQGTGASAGSQVELGPDLR